MHRFKNIKLALPAILISIFPPLFLYFNNIGLVKFEEIIKPLMALLLLPLVIYILLLSFNKLNARNASIFTMLFAFVYNFRIIENGITFVFPRMRYWHIIILFGFFLSTICLIIYSFNSEELLKEISTIISVVMLALILFNIFTSIPKWSSKKPPDTIVDSSMINENDKEDYDYTPTPNVYYFIFDEFASFEQIEKYYGYKNTDLLNFFEDNYFSNSLDSYNEVASTNVVTTNIINMEYVVSSKDNIDNPEYVNNLRANGTLFNFFRDHGYNVDVLGTAQPYGEIAVNDSYSEAIEESVTISGETAFNLIFNQTILYPLNIGGHNVSGLPYSIKSSMQYMMNPSNIPQEPTFLWAHFIFPHEPFYVDRNGKGVPTNQQKNWKDKQYYLGQYIYATKIMIKIFENIIENDPTAVIIVQSDHGARDSLGQGELKFSEEDKSRILNAVYYGGEKEIMDSIHGHSAVNTLRLVLNSLFQTEYDMLEVPYEF